MSAPKLIKVSTRSSGQEVIAQGRCSCEKWSAARTAPLATAAVKLLREAHTKHVELDHKGTA